MPQQERCPNCGSYDVRYTRSRSNAEWLFHGFLILITAGGWLLFLLLFDNFTNREEGKGAFSCGSCQYVWANTAAARAGVRRPPEARTSNSASPDSENIARLLKQLEELRNADVISPSEYATKRAEILKRI